MKISKLVFSLLYWNWGSPVRKFSVSLTFSIPSCLLPFLPLLVLCSHLYIGTKSVDLAIGNTEIEWLRILLLIESTLLQSLMGFFPSFFQLPNHGLLLNSYSFLLFCFFSENLGNFSSHFYDLFDFSNHLFSKMWPSYWIDICWQRDSQQWLQIIGRES